MNSTTTIGTILHRSKNTNNNNQKEKLARKKENIKWQALKTIVCKSIWNQDIYRRMINLCQFGFKQ